MVVVQFMGGPKDGGAIAVPLPLPSSHVLLTFEGPKPNESEAYRLDESGPEPRFVWSGYLQTPELTRCPAH